MKTYNTLSEAIADLQTKGYTYDLNLKQDCVECKALNQKMLADEFEIDQAYRFEGDTSPDNSSILYAISSEKFNLKGLLVDAYGIYADPLNEELIQKLRFRPK